MSSGQPAPGFRQTRGVETLVGDPKRAIIRLSVPMILAMSVQTIYNLVDAYFVSGLGADALAAVGLFFPFYFMMLALATGLGTGGGAALSRRIGAGDKEGADSVATHTIVYTLIFSLGISLPLLALARPIFLGIGAGDTIDETMAYANVLFAGGVIIFFANVANALLRGEGDANRAMLAMMVGGILNIFLDPVLIYTLGMGVSGAAWATLISLSVSAMILFYWLFFKRDTFVEFGFRGFRHDMAVARDIFRVGLPSSVQQLTMSINMLLLNLIIIAVAGTDGVAILTTGWRVITLGTMPLMGIATAVVSVSGATYGMRKYERMDTTLKFAIKIGLVIEMLPAVLFIILASQISAAFTQAETAAHLAPDIVRFFHITWIFLPGVALGMLSGAMFQGAGRGMTALGLTVFRTVVLTPAISWLLAVTLGMGLEGVWWGLVMANITGSVVSYTWANRFIARLRRPVMHPD